MVRGKGYGVQHHFQQYFSYIVTVCFIGGVNRSTPRKTSTCGKSLTNYIEKQNFQCVISLFQDI